MTPILSHERAAAVYGYLADFAGAYPRMCELEASMYRDLARAALMAIAEGPDTALPFSGAVDEVIHGIAAAHARQSVGRKLLADLKRRGVRVRFAGSELRAGPKKIITKEIEDSIRRNKRALMEAIIGDGLAAVG